MESIPNLYKKPIGPRNKKEGETHFQAASRNATKNEQGPDGQTREESIDQISKNLHINKDKLVKVLQEGARKRPMQAKKIVEFTSKDEATAVGAFAEKMLERSDSRKQEQLKQVEAQSDDANRNEAEHDPKNEDRAKSDERQADSANEFMEAENNTGRKKEELGDQEPDSSENDLETITKRLQEVAGDWPPKNKGIGDRISDKLEQAYGSVEDVVGAALNQPQVKSLLDGIYDRRKAVGESFDPVEKTFNEIEGRIVKGQDEWKGQYLYQNGEKLNEFKQSFDGYKNTLEEKYGSLFMRGMLTQLPFMTVARFNHMRDMERYRRASRYIKMIGTMPEREAAAKWHRRRYALQGWAGDKVLSLGPLLATGLYWGMNKVFRGVAKLANFAGVKLDNFGMEKLREGGPVGQRIAKVLGWADKKVGGFFAKLQ